MNKKISALRESQRVELENARIELANVKALISQKYKERNELEKTSGLPMGEKQRQQWFKENIHDLCRAEDRLEHRINYLEVELLEKKYAMHLGWSDVNPYEVIEEKTPDCYIVREMTGVETEESKDARFKSFIPGGFVGHFDNYTQDWKIDTDEKGTVYSIRRHKNGRWYNPSGMEFSIEAAPRKFYDFNF